MHNNPFHRVHSYSVSCEEICDFISCYRALHIKLVLQVTNLGARLDPSMDLWDTESEVANQALPQKATEVPHPTEVP